MQASQGGGPFQQLSTAAAIRLGVLLPPLAASAQVAPDRPPTPVERFDDSNALLIAVPGYICLRAGLPCVHQALLATRRTLKQKGRLATPFRSPSSEQRRPPALSYNRPRRCPLGPMRHNKATCLLVHALLGQKPTRASKRPQSVCCAPLSITNSVIATANSRFLG